MAATIEHLSSVIRQGRDHQEYRDPYRLSLTVRWLSPFAVELLGLDQTPHPSAWRDVINVLAREGVDRFLIRRESDGELSIKWVQVKPQLTIEA